MKTLNRILAAAGLAGSVALVASFSEPVQTAAFSTIGGYCCLFQLADERRHALVHVGRELLLRNFERRERVDGGIVRGAWDLRAEQLVKQNRRHHHDRAGAVRVFGQRHAQAVDLVKDSGLCRSLLFFNNDRRKVSFVLDGHADPLIHAHVVSLRA